MLLIGGCSDKCGDTKAIIQEKILTNEQLGKQTVEQVHLSWQTLVLIYIQTPCLDLNLDSSSRSQSRPLFLISIQAHVQISIQLHVQIINLEASSDPDQKSRPKSKSGPESRLKFTYRLEIWTEVQIQIRNLDPTLYLIRNQDHVLLFKHVVWVSPLSNPYFSFWNFIEIKKYFFAF